MIIKCQKCILRKWKPSDLQNLIKHANNPRIASNMRDGFPYPYTIEKGKEWLEFNNNQYNQNSPQNFAITLDDTAIGGIGLMVGEDIERISAETGYWLGEEYWGRGIISSALRCILDYGFNTLNLERIFAKPLENNMASRKVLEKNGFVLEGILRKSAIKSGNICNQALYAKIRE